MTYVSELLNDPCGFVRHYYLSLDPALFVPKQSQLMSDGTVRAKLLDKTKDYVVYNDVDGSGGIKAQPTRPRNRKGFGLLAAKLGGSEQSVKATRCFVVTPADALKEDDAFAAYICPYTPGQTMTKTVGAGADIMFTAEMTGCTFGVGSAAPDGTRLVCHSNDMASGNLGGAALQQSSQLQKTNAAVPGATAFQPDDYRKVTPDYETRATIVGIRLKGAWEFWAQVFDYDYTSPSNMQVAKFA
jgi:hypothetical protein